MLKFEPERRPTFQLEHSDFRGHYGNLATLTLLSIRRRWRFIASLAGLALALAFIALPLMPRKYSAVALIYPNLYALEQGQAKVVALASVDATSIVNSEARLIVSDGILQEVVRRLGLDRNPEASQKLSWLRALFFPETGNHSPFDRQVAMLRNKVEVMKDTRSYLISISYTASSADEAARIVNAIAVEYIRGKSLQRTRDAVVAAENELAQQLAVYGDKHPKVLQAADGLDGARTNLKAVMAPDEAGKDAVASDPNVKLAIPNRTPTSPRGFVVLGLALIGSLAAGMGLAVLCDRRGLEPRQLARIYLPEAIVWRRLGDGAGSLFQRTLAPLKIKRGEAHVLWRHLGVRVTSLLRRLPAAHKTEFGEADVDGAHVPTPRDLECSKTVVVSPARMSGARRRKRFRNRKFRAREEQPPGP